MEISALTAARRKLEKPAPSAVHRKLEKLVGVWKGEEHIYPSPSDPQSITTMTRVHNRLALDGFAVIQDYEQFRNDTVCLRGMGVFSWNSTQQCYTLHWFDSLGSTPIEYRGTFDNDLLVLTYQGPLGFTRSTFSYRNEDKYIFRQEVSPDGKRWLPFVEGRYTRA